MNVTVEYALSLWGLKGASYTLAAARENAVYRVEAAKGTYALRLHRAGYRTDAELSSELHWMRACAQGRIVVPEPLPAASGDLLQIVGGIQVDVLTWLEGAPRRMSC